MWGKSVWSWKRNLSHYLQTERQELWREYERAFVDHKHKIYELKGKSHCKKWEAIDGTICLWQKEYWDRFIRDERHFSRAVNYIMENPVKAGLVGKAEDWQWSWCR